MTVNDQYNLFLFANVGNEIHLNNLVPLILVIILFRSVLFFCSQMAILLMFDSHSQTSKDYRLLKFVYCARYQRSTKQPSFFLFSAAAAYRTNKQTRQALSNLFYAFDIYAPTTFVFTNREKKIISRVDSLFHFHLPLEVSF